MAEKFKEIDGYNGKYLISENGLVYNTVSNVYLKLTIDTYGYPKCNLYVGRKYKTRRVHRLVAEAFILNTENKPTVNHKNGIRHDNRKDNLEWATFSEQQFHSYNELGRVGAMKGRPSHKNSNAKKVIAIFKDGSEKEYGSLKDFAKDLNVIYTNASRVLRGKQKTINGIKLKYFGH